MWIDRSHSHLHRTHALTTVLFSKAYADVQCVQTNVVMVFVKINNGDTRLSLSTLRSKYATHVMVVVRSRFNRWWVPHNLCPTPPPTAVAFGMEPQSELVT